MLELLHTPLTVLHVIVCVMVMLVVLIQPGKSGGLGAALGGAGAQQIFGGRGAGNFLTRTTWISASVFFVTSITLAYISTSTGDSLQHLGTARSKAPTSETTPAAGTAGKIEDQPPAEPTTPLPLAPVPGSDAPATPAPSSSDSKPATP